ncbi:MAG: methyltransferase domain-containing protein [Betaproteobacteria bacterium]|nr:methyltransferase domain-containing protein [Betaproteobacteria bacterium]
MAYEAKDSSMEMRQNVSNLFRASVFFSGFAAWVLAAAATLGGELLWAAACAGFALAAHMAGRIWSRKSPVPMPFFMRWVLLFPRGPQAPKRFARVLQPRSGERILEVGPGVGVHALPIAVMLLPDGVLDVLDVQQEMLDELARRAARSAVTNIVPKRGDAQQLPYPDRTFDAAYLIGVLGEIPDSAAALRELLRVLKPDGRLVISEVIIDPDFISLPALREKAGGAGFVLERSAGPGFAYAAVFRPAAVAAAIAHRVQPISSARTNASALSRRLRRSTREPRIAHESPLPSLIWINTGARPMGDAV